MVERVVVHIGMHKTGSTAIQASLRRSYELLLEREILYPRAARRGASHHRLADDLQHTTTPLEQMPSHRALCAEVNETLPDTVIVSAEGLSARLSDRPPEWARLFARHVRAERIDVVGYVRPQWEYLEARYAELVKGGQTWLPFDRWLDGALRERGLDYLERFRPWREGLGDRLELRPYRADLLSGGDAVADFWDWSGLGTPPSEPLRANPRTGARTTEMLRLLRAFLAEHRLEGLLPAFDEPDPRPELKSLQKAFARARQRLEGELPGDDRPFSPLDEETLGRVVEHCAASNERFERVYLGEEGSELFAPPSERKQSSTWSLDAATAEERRVFARLLQATLAEIRAAGTERGRRGAQRDAPLGSGSSPPARAEGGRLRRSLRRRLGLS